jgi:hypothetical protein
MHTEYEIHELKEPEDVICVDTNTKDLLKLQITILTDLEGDIPYLKGLKGKPISPTTGSHALSINDMKCQLNKILHKKLMSDLGDNTALVIYQISPIWEIMEWRILSNILREERYFHGKEHLYDAGVWIVCTDNSTFPVGHDRVCISDVD